MKNTNSYCKGADLVINDIEQDNEDYSSAFFDTYNLNDEQVARLATALAKNKNLTYLNLFDCRMTKENLKTIRDALKQNQGIETVIIDRDIDSDICDEIQNIINKPKNTYKP